MVGVGDTVEFTEGGRRMRGTIESISHKAREFVLTVLNPDKTYRHPRVGFDRCRVPYDLPLAGSPYGIHQKVRIKPTHPMAGRVGTVTTLSPVDAQVDLGDGSMPWVPFDDLEATAENLPAPEPTTEQRETLLLAAAEMAEQENRPREPRCEKWKEEIALGLMDWEGEIPGRGVTFFTTNDGGIQVDAVDTDEEVGTVTFTSPHCRESVAVFLNARLKATRLDAAAGIKPEQR